MKHFAVALFCAVLFTVVPVASAPAGAAPFTSSKGYSIRPPKGWTTHRRGPLGNDVVFAAKPRNGMRAAAAITVAVSRPRREETIQSGRAQVNREYPLRFNGLRWISRGTTTVDGVPALFQTFTYNLGTPPRRFWTHQIGVWRNGLVYWFTGITLAGEQDSYKAAFDNAFKSIRWTKPRARS